MSAPNPVLLNELWAKIFVELDGGVRDGLKERVGEFADCSIAKAQSDFHQLRLVCRKFNDVIKDHPRLSRCLVLSPALSQRSLPSLLAWLQQHAASVQILSAYCGTPCLEAALAKLLPPQTLLSDVMLSQCSSLVVPLMSGLTSMTHCQVSKPTDSIDLTPLKELTKLKKLHLSDGKFHAAGLPAHLTSLTLEGAKLGIQHSPLGSSCVTSLRKLQVCDGHISGLHPRGLLACSAVEQLQVDKCSIRADDPDCCLVLADDRFESACLPTGMSALSSLSSLTVTAGNLNPVVPENCFVYLGPLHALPLLQELFVRSECFTVSLWLPAELGALQKLTSLTLSAPSWNDHAEIDHEYFPVAIIDVNWGGMHALECLKVHNWHFRCGSSILALTTLSHLSEVTFENCRFAVGMMGGESGSKYFAHTMQHLVRHCPHVKLVFDEELVA